LSGRRALRRARDKRRAHYSSRRAQPPVIGMRRVVSFGSVVFGSTMVSTPFWKLAVTAFSSTLAGSASLR
jgi:hypothetical protein